MIATTMSLLLLTSASQGATGYPMADAIAAKVVQKYNTATCADLAAERTATASAQKKALKDRAGDVLRTNTAMRAEFVNKVGPTIINKMIVCGFLP